MPCLLHLWLQAFLLIPLPSAFRLCSSLQSRLFVCCCFISTACREAYSLNDEQFACNLGCQSQLPFAEQRQEQVWVCHTHWVVSGGIGLEQGAQCCSLSLQLEAMMPRMHLLYPLTLVRGLWEDVMNQAHSFITSSWTLYLQVDDGKVVIFQVWFDSNVWFNGTLCLQTKE